MIWVCEKRIKARKYLALIYRDDERGWLGAIALLITGSSLRVSIRIRKTRPPEWYHLARESLDARSECLHASGAWDGENRILRNVVVGQGDGPSSRGLSAIKHCCVRRDAYYPRCSLLHATIVCKDYTSGVSSVTWGTDEDLHAFMQVKHEMEHQLSSEWESDKVLPSSSLLMAKIIKRLVPEGWPSYPHSTLHYRWCRTINFKSNGFAGEGSDAKSRHAIPGNGTKNEVESGLPSVIVWGSTVHPQLLAGKDQVLLVGGMHSLSSIVGLHIIDRYMKIWSQSWVSLVSIWRRSAGLYASGVRDWVSTSFGYCSWMSVGTYSAARRRGSRSLVRGDLKEKLVSWRFKEMEKLTNRSVSWTFGLDVIDLGRWLNLACECLPNKSIHKDLLPW